MRKRRGGLGPVGGRRLGLWHWSTLTGWPTKRDLVPGGVGLVIVIAWYDKRCLLITLPGLSRPKKPTQVVALVPPLERRLRGRSWQCSVNCVAT